jgi:hypothetical protein
MMTQTTTFDPGSDSADTGADRRILRRAVLKVGVATSGLGAVRLGAVTRAQTPQSPSIGLTGALPRGSEPRARRCLEPPSTPFPPTPTPQRKFASSIKSADEPGCRAEPTTVTFP